MWTCLGPGLSTALAAELSEFERETEAQVLAEQGWTLEPTPAGKLIESVDVFVVAPFDERDPMPLFVNALHVNSQAYVVKQELALRSGTRFDQRRVDDSLRALRGTEKFSLVLITTAKGSRDDRVRVLVIVKDIWSLRLNWGADVVKQRLRLLLLNPSEVNLFGTHSTLGALYVFELDRHTLGGTFYKPQVGPSNIGAYATGGVILERQSQEPEGSFGYFQYFRPLKSRYDHWFWSVGIGWWNEVTRRYQGNQVRQVQVENSDGSRELLPEVFETDLLAGEYELMRSFGKDYKTNVSVGAEVDRRRYRTPDVPGVSEEARATFERFVVPTSDTRISPFVQVRAYSANYHRLINVETLSLQEDIQLGHDALLRVYPASANVGSSRSLLGVRWDLSYSVPLSTGFARAKAGATIELSRDNDNDVLFDVGFRCFSPNLGIGRLHLDVTGLDRYRNYLNRGDYLLGGENQLRGYEYGAFRGDKVIAVNTEFRSVPLEVLGAHLGGVAFYDAADARDDLDDLRFNHSVGLGARVLFPQFDRIVFRVDWGVPLGPLVSGLPGGVTATFGQAFGLPFVDEPSVLDNVLPN